MEEVRAHNVLSNKVNPDANMGYVREHIAVLMASVKVKDPVFLKHRR